jgi:hypothetical protein
MEPTNEQLRFYVYVRCKIGRSTSEIFDDITEVFGDCVSLRTIQRYAKSFSEGSESCSDLRIFNGSERSVRSSELVIEVKKYLTSHRDATVNEIAYKFDIVHTTAQRIISEDLHLKSIMKVYVPHTLTSAMKDNRVTGAREWLKVLTHHVIPFVVFTDEKWFYHRSLGQYRSRRCWTNASGDVGDPAFSSPMQLVKRNQFEAKTHVIIGVTFDGKFYAEAIEKNKNVDSRRYIVFLKNMERQFSRHRNPLQYRHWIFIHDNARPHVSQETSCFLQSNGVNCLKQPAYSPDMNMLDRFVNRHLECQRGNKCFSSSDELIDFVNNELRHVPMSKWLHEKESLMDHLQKIIQKDGDYITE